MRQPHFWRNHDYSAMTLRADKKKFDWTKRQLRSSNATKGQKGRARLALAILPFAICCVESCGKQRETRKEAAVTGTSGLKHKSRRLFVLTLIINISTFLAMRIEFDPAKDAINCRKHGISLGEAERLDWNTAFIWLDERFDYDEWRMAGWGYIGFHLFYVAFVDKGDVRRIISLRRASKLEEKRYASS